MHLDVVASGFQSQRKRTRIKHVHELRLGEASACWNATARRLFTSVFCIAFCLSITETMSAQTTAPASQYTGPGSCSSPSCHGSVQPRSDSFVLQNEYSTWAVKDKHSKAFTVLTNPVSVRMGRILGISHPEAAEKCLACHALDISEKQKGRTFDLTDGVSCESCHGPASNWLGTHTTKGWTYEQSLNAGMYNTRDLIKRSDKCLSCHLGTKEKVVDHEMLAAGHPDLYFELDSFEAVMPRHWKSPPENDKWTELRTLVVGQAVQLRQGLRRLAFRTSGNSWPEYSELDCYSCHHSLTSTTDSWRQERGYPGRTPGVPPYELSRFAVFRKVVEQMDPEAAKRLDTQIDQVYKGVASRNVDRAEVNQMANAASDTAGMIAQRLVAASFDSDSGLRMMKAISADADTISADGERSAEQAAMALQSLFVACSESNAFKDKEHLRTAINGLFREFQSPSSYTPSRYARQMRAVYALL